MLLCYYVTITLFYYFITNYKVNSAVGLSTYVLHMWNHWYLGMSSFQLNSLKPIFWFKKILKKK